MRPMDRYLPSLSENASRWLRLAGVLVCLVVLGWIILDLRPLLTPIVVAAVVAYVFNPLIVYLERRGMQRLYAVVWLYAIGSVFLLALGLFLTLETIQQAIELRENIGTYVQSTRDWLGSHTAVASQPEATQPSTLAADWWQEVGPLVKEHGVALANSTLGLLTGFFSSLLNWLSIFVLIPMFAFFFLWKFNEIIGTIRGHLPAASRDVVVHLVTTADRAIANFFRGRMIVCLIVGCVTGIGWGIVGVPYSLLLGALAGLLNLVPFMSLLALPPALTICYFHAGDHWAMPVVLTMCVYMAVQALESFVLTPTIEAKSSGLHPLTTVVALMIGAQWAGLLGMLLAIPITSTLKVLAAEYVLPEVRRLAAPQAATESPPEPADGDPPQTGQQQKS